MGQHPSNCLNASYKSYGNLLVSLAPAFLHHVMYDEYFEIRSGVYKSVLDFWTPLPNMIIVQVLGYKDSIK